MDSLRITNFSDLYKNDLNLNQNCRTCPTYTKNLNTAIVEQNTSSYWYTILYSTTSCFDGSNYGAIQITAQGFSKVNGSMRVYVKTNTAGNCASPDSFQYILLSSWRSENGNDVGVVSLASYNILNMTQISSIVVEQMKPYNTNFTLIDLRLLPKSSTLTTSSTVSIKTTSEEANPSSLLPKSSTLTTSSTVSIKTTSEETIPSSYFSSSETN